MKKRRWRRVQHLDKMETQYKYVQGKENKEDIVKPIETVVEEYVRDP